MASLCHNELICSNGPVRSWLCQISWYLTGTRPSAATTLTWPWLWCHIIKTHVCGFFDTDLHEVSWHFATHKAVRSSEFEVQLTEWRSVSKKPFKMGFCFYPKLRMQIQLFNCLKTVSKVGDLSSMIAMTAHCFGALSRVRAIGYCVIGQERDLLWPDWLNCWVCPWVPAFKIQTFLTP